MYVCVYVCTLRLYGCSCVFMLYFPLLPTLLDHVAAFFLFVLLLYINFKCAMLLEFGLYKHCKKYNKQGVRVLIFIFLVVQRNL